MCYHEEMGLHMRQHQTFHTLFKTFHFITSLWSLVLIVSASSSVPERLKMNFVFKAATKAQITVSQMKDTVGDETTNKLIQQLSALQTISQLTALLLHPQLYWYSSLSLLSSHQRLFLTQRSHKRSVYYTWPAPKLNTFWHVTKLIKWMMAELT